MLTNTLEEAQVEKSLKMLSETWRYLKVRGSGEDVEGPMESTDEEVGPGKVEKHRRLEGKKTGENTRKLQGTGPRVLPSSYPKDLACLLMLSARGFPMSHPTSGSTALCNLSACQHTVTA